MASETVASDHASAAAEQIVNKEKSEAIADLITSLANEDEVKHDKPEDPKGDHTTLSSKTEDETNREPGAVEVQKSNDSPALEASAEDNLKHDKIEDAQTPAAPLSKTEEEPKPEPVVVVESTDDVVPLDAHIEEAEILETSGQKEEKPEPIVVATEVQEQTQEAENEPEEKAEEAEQRTTVTSPELPTEAITIEEKTRELSADILKETNESEAVPAETVKAEPLVSEVEENTKEPENQLVEKKEEEQSSRVAIGGVPSTESSEAVEEKTSELEVLKETNNYVEEPAEAEKAEPEFTKVDENSTEPEKESFKHDEEELPKTVIPEKAIAGDTVEVHGPEEAGVEVVKEIDTSEAEAVPEVAEKPGDGVVVHQPIDSDFEAVKETDTSQLEVVAAIEEKPEPVSTEVEEKPRELVEVAEDVGETSKEIETKQKIFFDTKIKESSADTIKDPIPLKEEKTDKEVETSITANTEKRERRRTSLEKTSSKDLPEETPTKPVQKQSHNIISKVKQSLVKARKAIIGKSPSSKNHSTEAKDDIPVK